MGGTGADPWSSLRPGGGVVTGGRAATVSRRSGCIAGAKAWPAARWLATLATMSEPTPDPEQAAARALDRLGIEAIWELYLSAAALYRKGNQRAAQSVIEVAEAAERIWLRRSENNRTE